MHERCTVALVTQTDLGKLLAWRNHADVRRFMLSQHYITEDEHRKWLDRCLGDPTRALLLVREADMDLGFVQLTNIAPGGSADWGFYAAPSVPKGSGGKLGRAALAYAFEHCGLNKVCGQALDFNAASIKFHQKMGFRQEGVLREQHCIDGSYHDMICFGLLRREWQSHNWEPAQ
jgi:UDP-4-amino-4,6-dideoxy-N-acetyl-beta-L-altrosamine N-acetyltransferase